MVYRHDDLAQMRSQLSAQKERLDKFEALYEREGVKRRKTLIGRFFSVIWKGLTSPFRLIWRLVSNDWLTTKVIIGGFVITGILIYAIWHQIDAKRQHREYDIRVEARVLELQCGSFCATHGYRFYEDRREDLCYCGTTDSEATAFIIDVETSENWTVSERHE